MAEKVEQSKKLSEQSQEAIKEVFVQFDKDNSGSIDYDEVKALAKELGEDINATDVQTIFKDLDTNNDGKITFDEFWVWWASGRPNKLEKLVYFKLKSMKLLKQAHGDFVRMGGSLDSKYDRTRDNHYIAINYGESPGDLRLNVLYTAQDDEVPNLIKQAQKGIPDSDEKEDHLRILFRLKSPDPKKAAQQFTSWETDFKTRLALASDENVKKMYDEMNIKAYALEKEMVVSALFHFRKFTKDIEGAETKQFQSFNEQSEAKIDATIGLKYSLDHLMTHLDYKFVKWLLSGFLIEGRLTMGRGALTFFRKILQQKLSSEKNNIKQQKYKKKLSQIALLSLLGGSKFHLVFKDITDIDSFFEGLGLAEMTEQQPTIKELLTELAHNFELFQIKDAPKPDDVTQPPVDLIWRLIKFFMDNGDHSATLQILHAQSFLQTKIHAPGLAKVVEFLATKPQEENEAAN